MKQDIDTSIYRSVADLARELGLGLTNTYRGLSNGSIPGIRIGNRWILPKAAIREWLKNAGGKLPPAAA